MKIAPTTTIRLALGVLALVGLVGVLPVSFRELNAGGACPHLGSLPACHIVSLAYGAMLISVMFGRLWNPVVFVIAWVPVILLAIIGSGLELMGRGTCPQTEGGIPKCFFSMGLACAVAVPFLIHTLNSRRVSANDKNA